MVHRYSSRSVKHLGKSFLSEKLQNAKGYDRIAGYFTSSIFEVAGEALETVQGPIRVVCNSEIDPKDLETARAARLAIKREWCSSLPEEKVLRGPMRFQRLYEFLKSGRLQIRVVPSEVFGLIHGKAGVITLSNGEKTSFLGSVNESVSAWNINYELVWEDPDPEAVQWVEAEFNALWSHPFARPLDEFIISDVHRIHKRVVVEHIRNWREEAEPAALVIEEPIYRETLGFAEHQKYFVKLAFERHRTEFGARFILADSVGLGKTVQLAMAAQLMALYGGKPILIIVPKTITEQWQLELKNLLDMPSAIWDGKRWIDENGNETHNAGPGGIKHCPRKIGIVSQGIIIGRTEAAEHLKNINYECVIVDESHRARRCNLGPDAAREKADRNNLLDFIMHLSKRTKSMLLATATPVQMHPIEAWDLLHVLAQGSQDILGNESSIWQRSPEQALSLSMGLQDMPKDEAEIWDIIRNPLPQKDEDPKEFTALRRTLEAETDPVIKGDKWQSLRTPDKARVIKLGAEYARKYNPFIRHIVRRTREYLENQIDEHGEPLLPRIQVALLGEDDPITLPGYLKLAYQSAEEFCRLLGKRTKAAGFLKTMLLRRAGSSLEAGHKTADRILNRQAADPLNEEDDDITPGLFDEIMPDEAKALKNFVDALEANKQNDPKLDVVLKCLKSGTSGTGPWLDMGCIIFSQYYDSVWWIAQQLTKGFPEEKIGIYAGGAKSGIMLEGEFKKVSRNLVKSMVARGEMHLMVGTDAASEGLNLQTLGSLINLDLPWNPTRLEQRKGRIQRIGQVRDTVYVYNMRYKDSVEDRVHELLSSRLKAINNLFGQIPDYLEDVWVQVALGEIKEAKKTIAKVPEKHPFELKYSKVEKVDWESCTSVLDKEAKLQQLKKGW